MTVRTVVISQGVAYCKPQGVAFVNLFLSPMYWYNFCVFSTRVSNCLLNSLSLSESKIL